VLQIKIKIKIKITGRQAGWLACVLINRRQAKAVASEQVLRTFRLQKIKIKNKKRKEDIVEVELCVHVD
jgi:hypothetical protein